MAPEPTILGRRWFDELKVGESWTSARRTLTEADVVAFAGVSGDFNPLHLDQVFAEAGPFGRRVVHGALVLSVATGLRQQLGVFNGSLKALLELRSWRFHAPVFIGDTVAAVTTIESLRETSTPGQGIVVQRVEVVNQDDLAVQSGELVSMMLSRPEADA
jgi:3-hydroxybutyryl-CoA dehydratase